MSQSGTATEWSLTFASANGETTPWIDEKTGKTLVSPFSLPASSGNEKVAPVPAVATFSP